MKPINQETIFWKRFVSLCKEVTTSPNAVCKELGFSNATATHWKHGAIPTDIAKKALANRFNISVEYLMGETEDRSPIEYSPKLSEGEEALLELFRQIPEDKQNLVLQMIEVALKTKQ